MTHEENLARAIRIAEKIFSMDSFSAQLRLIYTSPLREGAFNAEAIKIIYSHLAEVNHISASLIGEVFHLLPTITTEPATAPEKEEK